jgi:hypothetical protein
MILLLLTLATAAPPAGPMPVTAQERNALRDACAKLRGDAPATPATRAAFKHCVEQIPYDGDLPAKPKVKS